LLLEKVDWQELADAINEPEKSGVFSTKNERD